MNSTDVRVFCKIAETLSFREAADQLSMSRSAVSKKIAQLERDLGTVLINRTPRSLSLTESGKILLEHCREIDKLMKAAMRAVKNQDQEPAGTVLFSLPTSLGAALMPHLMRDFLARYPEVHLSAHFSESFVDVVAGGYDVAIRVAQKLSDSSLVAQRLMTTPKVLVASPGYLAKHGVPSHVRELKRHRCLGLGYGGGGLNQWRFAGPAGPIDVPVRYTMTANSDLTLNLAACLDQGFLFAPQIQVHSELKRGRLQIVLSDFCGGLEYGVYAMLPQRKSPAKVKVFVDFVKTRLDGLECYDRWAPLEAAAGLGPGSP